MPSTSGRDLEILLVQGSAVPSVNEFLQHPDFRQIAAFFLGWVFICSLLSIASSPTANNLVHRLTSHVSARLSSASSNSTGTSTGAPCVEKRLDLLSLHNHNSNLHSREDHFLTLMLFVCFAFASLANFSSLLTFGAGSGSSVCAFVIAWGGISAGCGRLFGLVALCIELHKLRVTEFEIYAMVVLLFAAVALVFAEYAVSIGTTEFLPQLGTYLCYRVRYLPTSLTTSLVFIALEVYIFLRLVWFIAPGFLSLRHRVAAIGDPRALRTASLILLELLTVIPGIKFVGIVGEFIPFAIGSLCVLGAFNKPIRCQAILDDGTSFHSISISNLTPHFRSYKSPSISIHPHISNPPFPTGGSTPSTIQIGPSVLWPHTTSNSQGSTPTSTTALSAETTMAQVAPRPRPASPRYTPPHDHSYTAVEHLSIATPASLPPMPAALSNPWDRNTSDGRGLSKNRRKNRILSRQDEYGARLEAEQEDRAHRTGLPIPPFLQVAVPPMVQDAPPPPWRPQSTNSVLYGSDIIRRDTSNRDGIGEYFSHPVPSATEQHSSFIGTVVSNQSWMSLVRSAASVNSPPLPEQPDRWLMFGDCSTSPTRRKTFTDQSILSALLVVPPTELSDVHFRSSRMGQRTDERPPPAPDHPPTHRMSRRLTSTPTQRTSVVDMTRKTTEDKRVAITESLSPGPKKIMTRRIRGPRPPPKVLPSIITNEQPSIAQTQDVS